MGQPGPNPIVRPATAGDEPFLWEVLYYSLWVPEGGVPFEREIVRRPEIARYLEGWGRPGDLAVVAVDAERGQRLGAAWLRVFTGPDRGYGTVAADVPELGIAVLPAWRGRGVGTALLQRLLRQVRGRHPAVSLSVAADNPARRLYERLGFEVVDRHGDSLTLLLRLRAAAR